MSNVNNSVFFFECNFTTGVKPSKTSHNTIIEIIWTVVPVLILVVIAVPSFKLLYLTEADKPVDMVIKVSGAQWYWNYEYHDGHRYGENS